MFKKDETRIENRKGATEGKSFKQFKNDSTW